jgi:hypothetical protein
LRRLHGEPATGARLCRRVPASDARSPLLREERLDPPPSGDRPGAARRLLQSNTIHEHDRSNRLSLDRLPRCPFPRPPVKACAFGSDVGRRLLSSATETLPKQDPSHDGRPSSEHRIRVARSRFAPSSRACARSPAAPPSDPAEVSRVRGWEAFAFPAPPVAIARNGSFAPTRSARTPAVVKLAAMPAGEASTAGHTRADVCPSRAHRASLLARGSPDTRC